MAIEVIQTKAAPQAIGAYSQGMINEGLVFTSGQIPIDQETAELVQGDFKGEVRQTLKNLDAVLSAGGSSLNSAIKLTVFLTDLKLFPQLNEVFSEFFPTEPPARSAVEVSALPLGARIEIEAIGALN